MCSAEKYSISLFDVLIAASAHLVGGRKDFDRSHEILVFGEDLHPVIRHFCRIDIRHLKRARSLVRSSARSVDRCWLGDDRGIRTYVRSCYRDAYRFCEQNLSLRQCKVALW